MTPQRYQTLTRALERRQPDLGVLLECVHKPHNLSAILRTCDAVGVFEAHAVKARGRFRGNRTASSGSSKWVPVRIHQDITSAGAALHQRGFRILAAHLSERAVDFRTVDYTQPTILLLGTEKFGVSDEALQFVDDEITVPMAGMVASLNVSVAAATILYEAQRQRQAAGYYDRCRLTPAVYRETLFRWGYPKLAALYERQGLPFPHIDDDGSIIDPPQVSRNHAAE